MMRCLFAVIALLLFGGLMEAEGKTVMVAPPNGPGLDDTALVLAAVKELPKSGGTLKFSKGTYFFVSGQNPDYKTGVAGFHKYKNLTIDGNGASFLFSGHMSFLSFAECEGLSIRNIASIDWDRPPFSIGEVIASSEKSFDVRVFNEYPVKGGEVVGAFMDFDPETRLAVNQGADAYYLVENTELIAEQTLRVNLKHPVKTIPGSWVALRHVVYGPNLFILSRCSDVNIRNILIYTCHGMGFVYNRCHNVTLEKLSFRLKPGTRHLVSATADANHFSGCTGTMTLKDCFFEGMGDDAANFKAGLYLSVRKIVDKHTIEGQHSLKIPHAPDPGDTMEICHVDDLLPYATVTVKSIENLPEGMHRIVFNEELPAELREGDVFGNATTVPKVRISGCTVRNNRARGFLVQTRDAIVENCLFENTTSAGVMVHTEVVFFFEAIGTRNIIIRNNRFLNCNYTGPIADGAIMVNSYLANFTVPPKPGIHRDIIIENNRIRGTDNSGIMASATDGIRIEGNTIEGACRKPTMESGSAAIYLTSSRNIILKNNTVLSEKQGEGLKEVLRFGPAVEQSTLTSEGNRGF